ncbi:MAG: hypothetical protein H7293_13445 [Candidatus Saccharibacteria bacterium]|nr:hypothetical protein [Rhodoferax sp.]
MNKKNETSGVTTGRTRTPFRWPMGLTVFFAMCYLAALSVLLGHDAMFYEPFVNAYEKPIATTTKFTGGAADVAVAKKYGQIDHAVVMAASGDSESNPGPAAVAAYESPPH